MALAERHPFHDSSSSTSSLAFRTVEQQKGDSSPRQTQDAADTTGVVDRSDSSRKTGKWGKELLQRIPFLKRLVERG